MRCIYEIERMKVSLPKQKGTTNEMLLLSFSVFEQLSSSLRLYSHCFG